MWETIVQMLTLLVGVGVLIGLWTWLRRWGALNETRALIGEALLIGSRGAREDR